MRRRERVDTSGMDSVLLLRAVREVSTLVDPEHPTTITQRKFDEMRSQSAIPNVPAAKRIVETLNRRRQTKPLGWARVLTLAHTSQEEQQSTISTQETPVQTWLTNDHIVFALRFVAHRLKTTAFTSDDYELELQRMQAEGIPVDELRIPSSKQIIRAFARKLRQREDALPAGLRLRRSSKKTPRPAVKPASKLVKRKRRTISQENAWKAALEKAGLEPVERAYLSAPNANVSTIELLERCFAAHETLPTRDEARTFARANNIPYSEKRQEQSWSDAVAAWKKTLEARGSVPPSGLPPRDQRPVYSRGIGAGNLSRHAVSAGPTWMLASLT